MERNIFNDCSCSQCYRYYEDCLLVERGFCSITNPTISCSWKELENKYTESTRLRVYVEVYFKVSLLNTTPASLFVPKFDAERNGYNAEKGISMASYKFVYKQCAAFRK